MDKTNLATLLVAVIAALSAYLSQRAASKASLIDTVTTSRVTMETEAYDRARAFDTETIRRQDLELEELRTENQELKREITRLAQRIARLERSIPQEALENIRVRQDDIDAVPE